MKLDMLGEESQFVDHLAPIWKALPSGIRGRFMTHFAFLDHAKSLGIEPSVRAREGANAILVASLGDMKRAQAMGYTNIARIEHGTGQSYGGVPRHPIARHGSYAGGEGAQRVGLFLVPNEHAAKRWRDAYPKAAVRIVGCPKLDEMPDYAPDVEGPIIAFSFHWNWHIIPETVSCFDAYREAVRAFALDHRVLGHAHPKTAPLLSRWFARNGIPYAEDFREVLRTAGLFVADNTSSQYEFAATGRPVVVLNLPSEPGQQGYRRDVNHGLRFWEAATVGVQVESPKGLREGISRALADEPEQQAAREAALDIVYVHRTGAVLRAANALTEWLDGLRETPTASHKRGAMSPADRVAAYRAGA